MLTNEQTARFKSELKIAYLKGVEASRWGDEHTFPEADAELSKIIWFCLHGAEAGQFKTKTEVKE